MPAKAEIRLAAAKKRCEKTRAALSAAWANQVAREKAAREATAPKIWATRKKDIEASIALRAAELAVLGITPMKTIVRWRGWLLVANVDNQGFTRWLPVSPRTRRVRKNRVERHVRERDVVVTDLTLVT